MAKKKEIIVDESKCVRKPRRTQINDMSHINNTPSHSNHRVILEPGEGGTISAMAYSIFNMPLIDTNDVNAVNKRIGEYFNLCKEFDGRPSVSGLALALGTDRVTLRTWITGQVKSKPHEVVLSLKRAYDLLVMQMEDYMQTGKINPVSGIFLMKNNFGYVDKQEMVVAKDDPFDALESPSDVEKRYLESIPTDEE